jgi:prepilin-type N-terminal cleavage/methylation domain-containing protein
MSHPSSPARRARARSRRGYTVVEVIMSLAVLAVGVAGVIAMQRVTAASNRHAKNLSIATHIGQAWLEMLSAESSLWAENGSLARTTWLAQGAGQASWFRPNYSASLNFGPGFDALGNPVSNIEQATKAEFCVDLRMTQMRAADGGSGLIRVEARVIWRREDALVLAAVTPPAQACDLAAVTVTNDTSGNLFHFLFMSSAVRQQVRGTGS